MKGLSYLLAANFEAVAIFLFAWEVGGYLNEKYPGSTDWMVVSVIVGFLIIIYTWIIMFARLIKTDKKE